MGALLSLAERLTSAFTSIPDAKVLMLGLDGAGKTTTLYNMKLGEVVHTVPTIGFNVERLGLPGGVEMTVWDLGGQEKIRRLWHYYYENASALVFIVDSADKARIDEVREELTMTLSADALRGIPVLIMANKQDLPGAKRPDELAELLKMSSTCAGHKWYVQGCCAVNGEGMAEGFDWLSKAIREKA